MKKILNSVNILSGFLMILPFFLIAVVTSHGQAGEAVVAKAGSITITKEEFIKRYEFIPHVRTDDGFDSASFKKNFLLTLIAEKLLAQSASKDGIEQSKNFLAEMENLTNVYLRDALYKKEILDKIAISDSAFIQGQLRRMRTVRTKFIFSQDKEEIEKIYSLLTMGTPFDSILATRPERDEQKEAAEVTFGTMNEKMENAVYITETGKFTPPVELAEGWYICKIYSVTAKMELDRGEKSQVEKTIRARIEDELYRAFNKKFFKGIIVNADRKIVEKLFTVFMDYLNTNKFNLVKDSRGNYKIGEADIPIIKSSFNSEELDEVVIKFQKDPVPLSKIFDYLSFQDFQFNKVDSTHVRNHLNSYISSYIKNEMLAREAKQRGYEKLPEVAPELKLWKDYYLAHEKMKKYFKEESVSDDDAYNYFVKVNQIVQQPDEYKIAEIITTELDSIESILNELDKGMDFVTLAAKFSSNESSNTQKGLSGFFTATEKGEIGKTVTRMEIGDVAGPIKTSDGYALIRLLDKKEGKRERVASFEEAKEEIKNIIRTEKMYKNLDDATAELAVTNGIQINDALLKSIRISTIDMIVLRRFGFGGQLLAVPFTPNFSNWFKIYENMKKKNLF